MKVLITGAGGFVGRHLIPEMTRNGANCVSFDQAPTPGIESITGDIRDTDAVNSAFAETKPDACIHLAGMSFVPEGNSNPRELLSVNITGTMNVLDAMKSHAPSARTLMVSTAHVYGQSASTEPVDEDSPLLPLTIYAASKAVADLNSLAFAAEHSLAIMTVRPNNHTGPGQNPRFAVPAFVKQLKDIANKQAKPAISVGNLQSVRDFSDVRDVVRAYRLLLDRGTPGKAYNLSSQHRVTMQSVVDDLCTLLKLKPEISVDPEKVRPTDASPLLDTSRIEKDTGWKPEIPFEQTLQDMINS